MKLTATFKVNSSLRSFARRQMLLLTGGVLAAGQLMAQGTFTQVTASSPHGNSGVMLLLTDGTVLCKTGTGGTYGNTWDKLTPNASGSYIGGSWSTVATMANDRLYFSSQVLRDGRVYVAGGEYGPGGTQGEVYDPIANTWTACPATGYNLSDANSEILPNGKVLQAVVGGGTKHNYIWDPATNTYTAGPDCIRTDNEAPWVKLPDNSILFVDNYGTTSERYIPSTNTWVNDGSVPVALYDPYGDEMGAGFLLPDGRVFFLGSSGHTAYYTPSGNATPGTFAAGPDIPSAQGTPDAAAAMMVNGKILCTVSPIPTSGNHFPTPTAYYEFDYTAGANGTFTQVNAPGGGLTTNNSCYISNMLDLPDGTVLFANQGATHYYVYNPGGTPLAAGKPTLDSVHQVSCTTFNAYGKLFNGITEGAAYGDDWQMETNYPIIRLSSGSNVYYAKTTNWNSTGVMRGALADTTTFTLPGAIPAGTYSVVVTANGNASSPLTMYVGAPAAVTSVTPPATICSGSAGTFTAAAATGATSYTWTVSGTGWSGSSTTSSINVTAGTGVGTLTVTAVNICGSSAAYTYTTTSTPPPTAPSIVAPPLVCGNASAVFSVSPVGGITGYVWTVSGAGWSGSSTSNTINVTIGAGVGTITCSAQNTCGTSPSSSVTSSPASIPGAATGINAPVLICNGNTATFDAPPVLGATAYVWTVSGTGWSGASTSTVITTTVGSGPGTLTVAGINACGTGTPFTLSNIQPQFIPAIPVIGNTPVPCQGVATTYSVTPVTGATGYIWNISGTGWSGANTNNETENVTAGTGLGTITVQSENACGMSAPVSINVSPNLVPSAASTIDTPLVTCSSDTGTFSTPAISGATSYTWTVSGTGWSGTSTTNSIQVTAGAGAGTITVAGVNACGTGTPYTLASFNSQPSPTASFSENIHTINITGSVLLNFTGSAQAGATYAWNFDGGTGNPGTGPGPQSVSWTTGGMKHITLTVTQGSCSATYMDSVQVNVPNSVQALALQNSISIVPNPNDGRFDLLFSQQINKPFTVRLYDATGRVVYTQQFQSTTNNRVTIATDNLPSAIYTATIDMEGVIANKKVTIMK